MQDLGFRHVQEERRHLPEQREHEHAGLDLLDGARGCVPLLPPSLPPFPPPSHSFNELTPSTSLARSHPQQQAGLLGQGRHLVARVHLHRDARRLSAVGGRGFHERHVQGPSRSLLPRVQLVQLTSTTIQLGAERMRPPLPPDVQISDDAEQFVSACLQMCVLSPAAPLASLPLTQ